VIWLVCVGLFAVSVAAGLAVGRAIRLGQGDDEQMAVDGLFDESGWGYGDRSAS
jgi:hypothetical protein